MLKEVTKKSMCMLRGRRKRREKGQRRCKLNQRQCKLHINRDMWMRSSCASPKLDISIVGGSFDPRVGNEVSV